jgi:hypothetical protein
MLLVGSCAKESTKNEASIKAVRTLVETYCIADFDGANLSTENYRKSSLPMFVLVGENEAPGWDTVSLVKAFTIKAVDVKGETATAVVSFDVLGEVPGAQRVNANRREEAYTFRLKKVDGRWKLILPADLQPHISVDTAISHIQGLYETEKESQSNAPKVIERLRELKRAS